jgi:hypothetical protein
VRKIHASGVPDANGQMWLTKIKRPPATSTQIPKKSKILTKKRVKQDEIVPDTSDEEDDGNDVVPAQMFYRDTCEMSEIPKY